MLSQSGPVVLLSRWTYSTLIQLRTCYHLGTNTHLDQCCLVIHGVLWDSFKELYWKDACRISSMLCRSQWSHGSDFLVRHQVELRCILSSTFYPQLISSSFRIAHKHREKSREMYQCLLGIFCTGRVKNVVTSRDCPVYLCNLCICMCSTEPFSFKWLGGYYHLCLVCN